MSNIQTHYVPDYFCPRYSVDVDVLYRCEIFYRFLLSSAVIKYDVIVS